MSGGNILLIGVNCEDLILCVPEYPTQDSKLNCLSSMLRRGGNAGNSAVVLSLLNSSLNKYNNKIYVMSPLSNHQRSSFVVSDLNKYNINTDFCIYSDKHDMTVAYIITSNTNKSRTIIAVPTLKPLTFQDFIKSIQINKNKHNDQHKIQNNILFQNINHNVKIKTILDDIQFIHVEARWINELMKILLFIKQNYKHIFISIEIEDDAIYGLNDDKKLKCIQQKTYPVNELIQFADLVFFSSQLVKDRGYIKQNNPKQFITDILMEYAINKNKVLTVIVPWGASGAYGAIYDGKNTNIDIKFAKSYPPKNVVDTIGAGDTFIGAFLYYISKKRDIILYYGLEECLKFACKVSGYKVGHQGFDCIKKCKL